MNFYTTITFSVIFFVLELLYFRIADHFNIIDKPNHRSSHTTITIRGGGIIFSLSLLLYGIYAKVDYAWFLLGLFMISFISFIDDVRPLSSRVRIGIHLIAVAIMFNQLNLFNLPWYYILCALIFVIGTINAINFMDGINGITGAYGLVTLSTLYYINQNLKFTNANLLLIAILSVIVFNFFNFRTKAKCFAGDVGSVSLAFIIIFFVVQLIMQTQNLNYFVLLLIYGLDTFSTIVFRIIRNENISEAHRSHFYQFLANEKKLPHLIVSSIYGLSQLIINIVLLKFQSSSLTALLIFMIVSLALFITIRIFAEGIKRLIGSNSLTKV